MAIIGIQTNRENPTFTVDDFIFWMPQFTKFVATEEGMKMFNKIYSVANQKVFYSIFGSDWELAMSYVIAHYMTLIANSMQAPQGDTLQSISGNSNKGMLSFMSVGDFSKSYDLDKTVVQDQEALFWNQTGYGAAYMALLKTRGVASMLVITPNPVPGASY